MFILLACCLLAAVQESKTASDDSKGAKTPQSDGDPRSRRDADGPGATATAVDDPVNGTDGVSEATFVRISERDSQPSDIDKEGGGDCYVHLQVYNCIKSTLKLYSWPIHTH